MRVNIILLSLLVFSLFLLSLPSVSAGCCVNDQATFTSTSTDQTCRVTTQAACPGRYVANSVDCRDVPECGCCVANPQSQNPQVYNIPNYLSTYNFCKARYPTLPVTIIPNMSSQQCAALVGTTGPILGGTGAPPPTPSGGVGDISGTLRSGGLALAGIYVDLVSATTAAVQTRAVSNAQGQFYFANQSTGSYTLRAQSCGYLLKEQAIINTNAVDTVTLELTQAAKERILIDVVDSNNVPLNNVSFSLAPSIVGLTIPSSQNGRAVIADLPSNCPYNVTATRGGAILAQSLALNAADGISDNPLIFTFATSGDPCAGITDCRGPDKVLGQGIDCPQLCTAGRVCSAQTGVCSAPQGLDCCSYGVLCPKNATITPRPASCTATQTGCSQTCSYLPECPQNVDLSIGSSGYLCSCGATLSVVESADPASSIGGVPAGHQYCCGAALSGKPCDYTTLVRVYGTVIDNLGPVAVEIVVDQGTRSEQKQYTKASGTYEIFLAPGTTHTLLFQKGSLYAATSRTVFASPAGTSQKIDITLATSTGPCDAPRSPAVPGFIVQNVPGKPAARLSWDACYCRSGSGSGSSSRLSAPSSFVLTMLRKGTSAGANPSSLQPTTIIVEGSKNSYTFENLDWDGQYLFAISAIYTDAQLYRLSNPVNRSSFDPGDSACEDRPSSTEFCADLTKR